MTGSATPRSGSWLKYQLVSRLVHMPGLLRLVASILRRYPALGQFGPIAARHSAVAAVFRRQTSFSNTAHAPHLVAGAFAIGMESGPRHESERHFLERLLPSVAAFGSTSRDESQRRIAHIRAQPGGTFDLVEDYMVWVAWSALRQGLGMPAAAIEAGPGHADAAATDDTMKPLFAALRALGAQLIIGAVAPQAVLQRAQRCAAALHGRIDPQDAALHRAWAAFSPPNHAAVLRNAVGLTWVGHPATVQACALVMQELLSRPALYRALRDRVAQSQVEPDGSLRSCLRDHILELLRFRPVFPLLVRDVPRDTSFSASPVTTCPAKAGSKLTAFALSAMFDAHALHAPQRYCQHRPALHGIDPREQNMVFGYGARACVAKDHVLEILVSALTDLLLLPPLGFADPWFARIRYDGPVISRMRLTFASP
jgi:hypothetical protein